MGKEVGGRGICLILRSALPARQPPIYADRLNYPLHCRYTTLPPLGKSHFITEKAALSERVSGGFVTHSSRLSQSFSEDSGCLEKLGKLANFADIPENPGILVHPQIRANRLGGRYVSQLTLTIIDS